MTDLQSSSIRVWDLPTRIFHWLFAASVIGAVTTVNIGGLWMDWHVTFGVAALMLLIFRVIWGFAGPRYARFKNFVVGPKQVWLYLRGSKAIETAGHNPLGAWSVMALLLVVGVQAVTGLFASDDILTNGPLNSYVSSQTASLMTTIHKWNKIALLALVGLHLVAILIYTIRGKGLVKPMITGDKPSDRGSATAVSARDDWAIRLWALLLFAALSALGWWLIELGRATAFSF
jgi:cytochrome b